MGGQRLGPGALVVVMLLAAPRLALCGEPTDSRPRPGDRVRVEAPAAHKGRVTGTLVTLDDASMTLILDKTESRIEIPQTSISQLDVFRGSKRCTAKGALFGALAGAALMALYFSGENDLSDNSGTGDVIGGFAFFLLPPSAVGALVGTAVKQDRWVTAKQAQTTVSQGRIVAGVTIRF